MGLKITGYDDDDNPTYEWVDDDTDEFSGNWNPADMSTTGEGAETPYSSGVYPDGYGGYVNGNGDPVTIVANVTGAPYDMQYLYYIQIADVGTYNLVINFTTNVGFNGRICNYSGVDNVKPLVYKKTKLSYPASSVSIEYKATTTDSWVIGGAHNNSSGFSGTNLYLNNGTSYVLFDSNGSISTASTTY